jgi:hypothetical protein
MASTSWLIVRPAVFSRWVAWVGGTAALMVTVASVLLAGVVAPNDGVLHRGQKAEREPQDLSSAR